jgi:hypothetical protein
LGLQALLFCALIALSLVSSLQVSWRSGAVLFTFDAVLICLWLYLWRSSAGEGDRAIAETVGALGLTLILSHILAPAQYYAVATRFPLIDGWLAGADQAIGVDVARLSAWTSGQPLVAAVLRLAYSSLLPQFALVLPIIRLGLRDREAFWEYVFNFHFCALATVTALAVFPAACAFQYLGFQSTIDQTRFIQHFNGVRSGTFSVIRFDNLEGLISMPSFHVAGALMICWAVRRHRRTFRAAIVLNSLLIASTVMTGAHYFVDVPGTMLLFALSVMAWNRWGRLIWDGSDEREAISAACAEEPA